MEFNLKDYKHYNLNHSSFFPKNFFPYIRLDRKKYSLMEEQHKNHEEKIADTFKKLEKRVSKEYFQKIYPAQSSALSFSERTFPAYRFLLPEVLNDDWLGIVDFHKKFSRDHALHQPLTAYIVYKLLGGGIPEKSLEISNDNLLKLCVDQIFDSPKMGYIRDYLTELGGNKGSKINLFKDSAKSRLFWNQYFFETAFVSAIFHDIGYPWQYINNLNHGLSKTDFTPNNLASNSKDIFESFEDRLIMYPFNGYKTLTNNTPTTWKKDLLKLISQSLKKTHGFPGALGFLYLNDILREFPAKKELPFNQFCVDWAALGIMMHDLVGIYNTNTDCPPENSQMRLEFDRDPLSCIITLADLLEEFERPNVKFREWEFSSNCKYDYSCSASTIEVDKSILNIVYQYKSSKGVAAKIPFIAKEEKKYFDPDYGYLDFSSIGINKVRLYAISK